MYDFVQFLFKIVLLVLLGNTFFRNFTLVTNY